MPVLHFTREAEARVIGPGKLAAVDDELKSAYLRGLFQAIGSINDPKTARYHMEFLVDNRKYAEFISNVLNYFNLSKI